MQLEMAVPPALERERLPVAGLLALAMTGFLCIVTETLPAGLLQQIGASLRTPETLTGQMITIYACGSLVASIPLTAATQGYRRRPVLLATILGFLLFNTMTALSGNYALAMVARFAAGVTAGLAWGIIAGYARRMVPGPLNGRAMTVAMIGVPLALSFGVPIGAWMGSAIGWRYAFLFISFMALLLVGWVLWKVEDFPGQEAATRMTIGEVFTMPGMRPLMVVVLTWMTAHTILYTYIVPFSTLATVRVDLLLLEFGVFALAAISIVGLLMDDHLRTLLLCSLGAFLLATISLAIAGGSQVVVYVAVAVWGLSFGGAGPMLQTAVADAAGKGVDVAQAMMSTAWNAAIAAGGILGGFLLSQQGASAFPLMMLALLLIALGVAWSASAHGLVAVRRRPE